VVARDYAGFTRCDRAIWRLLRFEDVWRRLGDGEPAHWDRIAADGGYADQSHLIRDFRQFTGGSPVEFLARSIPGRATRSQEP